MASMLIHRIGRKGFPYCGSRPLFGEALRCESVKYNCPACLDLTEQEKKFQQKSLWFRILALFIRNNDDE